VRNNSESSSGSGSSNGSEDSEEKKISQGGVQYSDIADELFLTLPLLQKTGKKNIQELIGEVPVEFEQAVLKKQFLEMKKSHTVTKSKQVAMRCSVFDIPSLLWHSNNIDSFYFFDKMRQKVGFQEFSKNRQNFKFLQEFNGLNDYSPHVNVFNSKTGDVIQVHKGFIQGLYDQEDDQDSDKKYEFLAEANDDMIDFSDPAALMRRQKKILEKI
jgi:hypothetical protein